MSFRRLLAILFAVAMIAAPLAMPAGEAMAAAPMAMDHDGEQAMADHCGGKADPGQHGKQVGDGCCAAMCLGIALTPAAAGDLPAYAGVALRPSADQFHHSYLARLPTPPPRRA